jgi:hypothetical protein
MRSSWSGRLRRAVAAAGLVSVAWAAAACSADVATGPRTRTSKAAELERARDRWQSRHLGDYAVTIRRDCFCIPEARRPVRVHVHAGVVVSARFADTGEQLPAELSFLALTVDQLFALADDAVHRAGQVEVTYDAIFGYPRIISVDYQFDIADDELVLTAADLEPAS